jgi:hypothetical protein
MFLYLEATRDDGTNLSRRVTEATVHYVVAMAKAQGFTVYVNGVQW